MHQSTVKWRSCKVYLEHGLRNSYLCVGYPLIICQGSLVKYFYTHGPHTVRIRQGTESKSR